MNHLKPDRGNISFSTIIKSELEPHCTIYGSADVSSGRQIVRMTFRQHPGLDVSSGRHFVRPYFWDVLSKCPRLSGIVLTKRPRSSGHPDDMSSWQFVFLTKRLLTQFTLWQVQVLDFGHPATEQQMLDWIELGSKLGNTCVSAFVEILLSLQCKIFQYTFLEQYPMEFQDFFSLCQIQQLTLLQLDHRKLGPSETRLLSDPCIIKLKRRKNTLPCVIWCFEKHFLVYLLNLLCIKIAHNIYFIHTNF